MEAVGNSARADAASKLAGGYPSGSHWRHSHASCALDLMMRARIDSLRLEVHRDECNRREIRFAASAGVRRVSHAPTALTEHRARKRRLGPTLWSPPSRLYIDRHSNTSIWHLICQQKATRLNDWKILSVDRFAGRTRLMLCNFPCSGFRSTSDFHHRGSGKHTQTCVQLPI